MKTIIILSTLIIAFAMSFTGIFRTAKDLLANKSEAANRPENVENIAQETLYDFSAKSLDGKETIDFSRYKGKKVVIINVASKCGYTPQYADWQKFHEEYGNQVVVLGFPANEFLAQESGENSEIATFCQKNYGVTFQLFEKLVVKGEGQHPLYQWLSNKSLNGWNDKAPSWNFCKYVINEKGELTHFFASAIKPNDKEFQEAIKN